MTLNSHGTREGSKADRPEEAKVKEEKDKEKAEEEEESSDQEKEKAEEKEERKAAFTWWVRKDMKKNGMKEMNGMVHGMMATRPLGRWSELEWKLLGLWRSVLHRWVWIVDISRRKEKGKKRKARKGKNDEGKGENQEMEKDNPTMFNQPQTSSTPALQNR